MLVPNSKLLFWFALLVLPFALLGGMVASVALLSEIVIGAFLLIVLADAIWAVGRLDGIHVELPEVVRFSKNREGCLELRITTERQKLKRVRLGLAFPPEIVSPHDDLLAALPPGSAVSRLLWPCTPLQRGVYRFEQCYLEGTSPLGFWARRGIAPIRSELRVYPDLSQERSHLAALFSNRGSFGIHAQRQIGKGRDFEKLREYIPGDSYEDIHWKATARRNRPITKVFQIERTQEIYVILDASRLSARTTDGSTPLTMTGHPERSRRGDLAMPTSYLERFITAAMVLGLAAQKQGDLFGVVTFSDQIHGFARAKSGKAHYSACRDLLYTLEPKRVNPDFDELCAFLRLRLRRRALLVLLTNLDDPVLAESFVKNVALIQRQHLILVNMLRPAAAQPLFAQPIAAVDDLYQALGGHLLWHDLRELERELHHRGVHFALLENERMCVELVSQYLTIKRRQLL